MKASEIQEVFSCKVEVNLVYQGLGPSHADSEAQKNIPLSTIDLQFYEPAWGQNFLEAHVISGLIRRHNTTNVKKACPSNLSLPKTYKLQKFFLQRVLSLNIINPRCRPNLYPSLSTRGLASGQYLPYTLSTPFRQPPER